MVSAVGMALAGNAPDQVHLSAERVGDAAAIERLLDRAFGPGRFAKVSERVREQYARPLPDLSRVALRNEAVIGCCRISAIAVSGRALCFLGPLAVDPDAQSHGLGAALVEASLAACSGAGYDAVLLVGAPAFFGKRGFTQVPAGRITFPGPVEPARVHWRGLTQGHHALEGLSGPITRPEEGSRIPAANPP